MNQMYIINNVRLLNVLHLQILCHGYLTQLQSPIINQPSIFFLLITWRIRFAVEKRCGFTPLILQEPKISKPGYSRGA
jgi:hypothetical protein